MSLFWSLHVSDQVVVVRVYTRFFYVISSFEYFTCDQFVLEFACYEFVLEFFLYSHLFRSLHVTEQVVVECCM
jgi:hypothetical protein